MAGLTQNQVEKVVEAFLNTIAAKDPSMKNFLDQNRKMLVQSMTTLIMKQKPDLSIKDLNDKVFLKKMTVALVTTLTLNRLSLDINKNFCERIKAIFNGKDDLLKKMLDPKFDPKELEKLLTKEEKQKLQEEIKRCCAEIINELRKMGLIKLPEPKPDTPKPKLDEEMSKVFEPYANLFGLINVAFTGSTPAVVQCMVGNGLGITDWNPDTTGYDQIGLANKTSDTEQGDSLGLNALAIERCLRYDGDALVDNFLQELHIANKEFNPAHTDTIAPPSTAPKPRGPGSLPGMTPY